MSTSVEPWLLEILRCPASLARLIPDTTKDGASRLVSADPQTRLAYRVEDAIAVLLVDEAVELSVAEHQVVLAAAGQAHCPEAKER